MSGDVLPRASQQPPAGRAAVKVALLTLTMSIPVGGAWFLLAPLPPLQVTSNGVLLVGGDSEVFIAADAWFAICGATGGAVAAVLAFLIARSASPLVLIALAGAGVAGALAAWRLGVYLGPAPVDVQAKTLSVGERFDGPLELSALGVLLAWPLVSVAVYFSLVAGLEPAAPSAAAAGGRRRRPRGRRRARH